MTARVLAVVVSYRTPGRTVRCVQSLLADASGVDALRVVVVDNASGDDTAARVRALGDPRVTVLENPRNTGYGAACNQGAATDPTAGVVLFLNADTEIAPGALSHLSRALAASPGVGVVAPLLEESSGVPRHSVRGDPTPLALLHQHTALRFLRVGSRAYARYKTPDCPPRADGSIEAPVLNGAALALSGETVRRLGGFDPRYFLYFEEADLCRRVRALGLTCRQVPDAVIRHHGGASSSGRSDRALVWYLASLFLYVDRFHGRRTGLLFRAVFKPLFLVRMVTDAVRDLLGVAFRPDRRERKRAELRLAARFFTRGMWTFLGS